MSTGVGATLIVDDHGLGAELLAMIQGLDGNGRQGLNEAIGRRVGATVRAHLLNLAATRHDTANAMGATPSGHLARAAESVVEFSTESTATISIFSPGIARAFRDITIVPTGDRKFLTIPVIKEAYNQRAYRVRDLVAIVSGDKGVLMKPQAGTSHTYKTRRYDRRRKDGAKYSTETIQGGRFGTVWYVLVRRVTQKQDRSLLPSDEQFRIAAQEGARDYVDFLISTAEKGANS